MKRIAALALVLVLLAPGAMATEACTLVVAAADGHEVYRSGTRCGEAFSPASTFKLALALMGYDSGLLQGPDAPAIAYDPALDAPFASWRQTVTPVLWLKESVVWYSQALTRQLGMARFQAYVDAFDYGNRDLEGDPGANNGLTRAWLGSSLRISPVDQVAFLRRILLRQVPVSAAAHQGLFDIVQRFDAPDGWQIMGKTGSAWPDDMNGRQLGWFVGWMQRDGTDYVFARLFVDMPHGGVAGSEVRDSFLIEAGPLMASLGR